MAPRPEVDGLLAPNTKFHAFQAGQDSPGFCSISYLTIPTGSPSLWNPVVTSKAVRRMEFCHAVGVVCNDSANHTTLSMQRLAVSNRSCKARTFPWMSWKSHRSKLQLLS
jgi:hypothetical protein